MEGEKSGDLYISTNIPRMIKSWRARCAGKVARMGSETRGRTNLPSGKLKEKVRLEELKADESLLLA